MNKIKTIFIAGPTASGKTSLGVEISRFFGGEVISADSMQIYKYMNIATAKPTVSEMNGIPHHMIDFVEPDKSYSVAKYKEDALKCIHDVASKGKLPVVVGGTGLYIDTLIYNTEFFDIETDVRLRQSLYEKAEKVGCAKMWEELHGIDPKCAAAIHQNNIKKIIRALEVYYQTGKTITMQNELSRLNQGELDSLIFCLDAHNRQFLYDRINKRVDVMLSQGLVDEAAAYYEKYGVGTASQAIGYKELLPYLMGELSLEECVENLKMQSRRYAKRQLTWFKKNTQAHRIYIDEDYEGGAFGEIKRIIEREK